MKEITNYFHWQWPIEGDLAGFIKARMLPNIGEWKIYTSSEVMKLIEKPIHKPEPEVSAYSHPQKAWTIPIAHEKGILMIYS